MSDQPIPDSSHSKKDPNHTPSKRRKHLWLILVILIAALSCGIVMLLKYKYSPDRCVEQFLTALDHQDYHKLKTFLTCNGVDITEESLKPFIELYHSDKQFKRDIRNTLNRDLDRVDLDTYNSPSWIKLIAHRKFLVKTYTIKISPVHISFASNLYPVNVTCSDETYTLESADSMIAATILPGKYHFDTTYYDPSRDKEMELALASIIKADQTVNLSYPSSNLILTLPEGYQFESLVADDVDITEHVLSDAKKITFSPVFNHEVLTITCRNPWGQKVTTSFSIPDGYQDKTYVYRCDFTTASKEFTFEKGLKIATLKINGQLISNPEDFITDQDCTLVLNNLSDGDKIEITLETPWGETFCDTYNVSTDNFNEYSHTLAFEISSQTKETIMQCALKHYLKLIDAFNKNDIEKLADYADDDEMASDLYITLENIKFDYENYEGEPDGFEESIRLEPLEITADQAQLNDFHNEFVLNLFGRMNTLTTSKDENSEPAVSTSESSYNVQLHITYDTKKKKFKITAGYYDENPKPIRQQVSLY